MPTTQLAKKEELTSTTQHNPTQLNVEQPPTQSNNNAETPPDSQNHHQQQQQTTTEKARKQQYRPNPSNIVLRSASYDDAPALLKCLRVTFAETYPEIMAQYPEEMKQFFNTVYSLPQLQQEFQTKNSIYYILHDTGAPHRIDSCVGFIKLNWGESQTLERYKDKNCLQIQRLYLVRAVHGMKLGPVLLRTAIHLAQIHNYAFCWLGVYEANRPAIEFYKRIGFVFNRDKFDFMIAQHRFIDYVMILNTPKLTSKM